MNDQDYTGSTSVRDLFALCWKLEGCDIHWLPYDIRTRKFDGICVSDLGSLPCVHNPRVGCWYRLSYSYNSADQPEPTNNSTVKTISLTCISETLGFIETNRAKNGSVQFHVTGTKVNSSNVSFGRQRAFQINTKSERYETPLGDIIVPSSQLQSQGKTNEYVYLWCELISPGQIKFLRTTINAPGMYKASSEPPASATKILTSISTDGTDSTSNSPAWDVSSELNEKGVRSSLSSTQSTRLSDKSVHKGGDPPLGVIVQCPTMNDDTYAVYPFFTFEKNPKEFRLRLPKNSSKLHIGDWIKFYVNDDLSGQQTIDPHTVASYPPRFMTIPAFSTVYIQCDIMIHHQNQQIVTKFKRILDKELYLASGAEPFIKDIRDPLNFMAKVSDKYWSDRCLKATLEYKRAGSAENAGHWCIARLQRQQL